MGRALQLHPAVDARTAHFSLNGDVWTYFFFFVTANVNWVAPPFTRNGFNFLVWDTVLATQFTCWILTSIFFFAGKANKQWSEGLHIKKKVMFELTYCWILVSFHASGRTLCKAPHPRTASCLKAVDWMRHATICWTLYSHRADKHNTLCWKAHHIVLKSTRQCAEKQHCFF